MSVSQSVGSQTSSKPRKMGERLPTRPRLRGQAFVGGILILICALLAAWAFVRAGDRESVVTVKNDVAVGQKIDSTDLASKQVAGVGDAIAYTDRNKLIGKTAKVGLVSGQILSDSMVTATPVPGPNQALAGLSLTRSQIPGAGLETGDTVRLVKVANPDAATGQLAKAAPLVESATIYAVKAPDSGTGQTSTSVTVVVPQGNADDVAAAAAAGQIALVKMPAGTGGQ